MARKGHADRVEPVYARQAIARATRRTHVWSEYIVVHFRSTGQLAPGCDYVDLYEWMSQRGGWEAVKAAEGQG